MAYLVEKFSRFSFAYRITVPDFRREPGPGDNPMATKSVRQSEGRTESGTILGTILQGPMNPEHVLFTFLNNRERLYLISRRERV